MSETKSPWTGKAYGIARVCQVSGYARSSFYARKDRQGPGPQRKRGPKPKIGDAALLERIKKDLDESLFEGEGHRKVWARLKFGQGLRVSRKRVLRLMRAHNLLSPYRRPQGEPQTHDGHIVTDRPNDMWGTDGAKVFTLEQGYCWIFVTVEHWNGQCIGCHVCKYGNRFAALEPVSQGVMAQFGSVEADAARGLSLRMDHGTQYLSDHFQQQIKHWGIAPSFAFLEQPQTNGVAERFIRTLKEQAVYGRTFRNVEELREAVGQFIERYNRHWRLEKNGYLSAYQMREAYAMSDAA